MTRSDRDPLEDAYNGGLEAEPPEIEPCPEPRWLAWWLLGTLTLILVGWWLSRP